MPLNFDYCLCKFIFLVVLQQQLQEQHLQRGGHEERRSQFPGACQETFPLLIKEQITFLLVQSMRGFSAISLSKKELRDNEITFFLLSKCRLFLDE